MASRFPWLCIDEYQDLGGALHNIVLALTDLSSVRIFAVGDPDQTIYDFLGAKVDGYIKLEEGLKEGNKHFKTPLKNFASFGKLRGKVVLTTFHASKGWQFDVVVIPGCSEGSLPPCRWQNGRPVAPFPNVLNEKRRLFYVGLSRARKAIHLISSDYFEERFGNLHKLGVSRFVREIRQRLTANE